VVLTGAGISQESGIKTFRDADGLWEGHDVMEVASPEGWRRNQELVLDFYNQRRAQLHNVKPNPAHIALSELETEYEVTIVTQNVDDLHERGGSSRVIHLHGELFKVRCAHYCRGSIVHTHDLHPGDFCDNGHQLRPDIVWFGESVRLLETAAELVSQADILLIVGTSMQVYPAAGLYEFLPPGSDIYYIDPSPAAMPSYVSKNYNLRVIADKAGNAVPLLVARLLSK